MTTVRAAVIQAHANMPKDEAVDKHVELIAKAAADGAEVTCLQEIFHGPYFCAEQDPKWYATAEPEDGPIVTRMREVAQDAPHGPDRPVVRGSADRRVLQLGRRDRAGRDRRRQVPEDPHPARRPVLLGEVLLQARATSGTRSSTPRVGKVGLIICYDRHFPEIGRALGLKGAELVFNPSATVESLSKYLWELEQPATAVANGYWIAAINRVGVEEPLSSAKFYGSSYFCDPRGQIVAQASDSEDEVLVHDLDLEMIREVRNTWQFLRDRRPELYGELTQLLP